MASLFLFDEHVAWQKRVQKEIFVASKFMYGVFSEEYGEEEPKLMVKLQFSRKPSPFVEFRNRLPLSRGRVYAEVRGKYARPDRTVNPLYLPCINERTSTVASSCRRTGSTASKNEQKLNFEDEEKDLQEMKRLLRQERLVKPI